MIQGVGIKNDALVAFAGQDVLVDDSDDFDGFASGPSFALKMVKAGFGVCVFPFTLLWSGICSLKFVPRLFKSMPLKSIPGLFGKLKNLTFLWKTLATVAGFLFTLTAIPWMSRKFSAWRTSKHENASQKTKKPIPLSQAVASRNTEHADTVELSGTGNTTTIAGTINMAAAKQQQSQKPQTPVSATSKPTPKPTLQPVIQTDLRDEDPFAEPTRWSMKKRLAFLTACSTLFFVCYYGGRSLMRSTTANTSEIAANFEEGEKLQPFASPANSGVSTPKMRSDFGMPDFGTSNFGTPEDIPFSPAPLPMALPGQDQFSGPPDVSLPLNVPVENDPPFMALTPSIPMDSYASQENLTLSIPAPPVPEDYAESSVPASESQVATIVTTPPAAFPVTESPRTESPRTELPARSDGVKTEVVALPQTPGPGISSPGVSPQHRQQASTMSSLPQTSAASLSSVPLNEPSVSIPAEPQSQLISDAASGSSRRRSRGNAGQLDSPSPVSSDSLSSNSLSSDSPNSAGLFANVSAAPARSAELTNSSSSLSASSTPSMIRPQVNEPYASSAPTFSMGAQESPVMIPQEPQGSESLLMAATSPPPSRRYDSNSVASTTPEIPITAMPTSPTQTSLAQTSLAQTSSASRDMPADSTFETFATGNNLQNLRNSPEGIQSIPMISPIESQETIVTPTQITGYAAQSDSRFTTSVPYRVPDKERIAAIRDKLRAHMTSSEANQGTTVGVIQAGNNSYESLDNMRTCIVQKGDSYWTIAKRELDDVRRWREIRDLNKGRIGNQEALQPGTELLLPGNPT